MSVMTPESIPAAPSDDDSFNTGLIDGEIAATTRLSARRAHARAAMADQYDPLYAQGYIDGYLHGIELNAAYLERQAS